MSKGYRAAWKSNKRKEFSSNRLWGWSNKNSFNKKIAIRKLRKKNTYEISFQYKEYWEESNEFYNIIDDWEDYDDNWEDYDDDLSSFTDEEVIRTLDKDITQYLLGEYEYEY